VSDIDAEEANDLLNVIVLNLQDTGERVKRLWKGRAWIALGYPDWAALVDARIRPALPHYTRGTIAEQAAELKSLGMSTRAIAPVLGVSDMTVRRKLDEAAATDVAPAEPTPITGLDGKQYPARPPRAAPDPEKVIRGRVAGIARVLEQLEEDGLVFDRAAILQMIAIAVEARTAGGAP
jgi:hypothetical protein